MTSLLVQWNITGGSILIFGGLLALAGVFFQFSRVGSQTVQVLQIRADTLARELDDARATTAELQTRHDALVEAAHQAELAIKDREKEIERYKTMPDTEQMLGVFEAFQTATLKAFGELNSSLTPIAEGIASLVERNRPERSTD
jgi:hypothetical protein